MSKKPCRIEWPRELESGTGHFHRCQLKHKHGGACWCECGMQWLPVVRGGRYAPDSENRVPAYKIRGGDKWTELPDTGLEVLLTSFGSQDNGWAWIQVREVTA